MKTKIVEHLAGEALHALNKADLEAVNLRDNNRNVFVDSRSGPGLDLSVLREELEKARRLIELLA